VPSLQFDVTAIDRASRAFNQIADKIDMLVARLAALSGTTATANVDVDTDPADRTLGRWEQTFRRRVRDALATIPTDIELRADATDVEVELGRIRRELAELTTKRVGIDITAEDAIIQIRQLKGELAALDASDADIQVRADVASAIAALEEVLAEARRVDGTEATIRTKVDDKGFRDILNAAALFQRSFQQLIRGPGLVLAIPGIVSLLADLENLLGLLGLVPGAAFGAIAAFGALTVGMQGFGTAIGDLGDTKKFNEDLKNLTPVAQQAAKALKDLQPTFFAIKNATQDHLFRGVADEIRQLNGVLPTVRAGLAGIAGSFNTVFIQWAKFATSVPATIQLGALFENVRAAVANLAPGITAVAQALTDMAVVGARMLPQFAKGFSDVAQEFQQWIAKITANGQFEQWIRGAIDVLNQLGDIAKNTWTGLQGLFTAIEAAGPSTLDVLQQMAKAFTDFTNSAAGQEKLIAFFNALQDIGASIGPAIGGIFTTLAATLVTIAPAATAVGTAFSAIVTSLGPGVVLFGAIASTLTPIATGFTALLNVLGPLPAIVLAAFLSFRAGGAILGAAAAAIGVVIPLIERLGLSLIGLSSAAGVGGALGGLGLALGRVGTALAGVATFLTGPWGFAILAAVAVLGILSSGQDDAAAAADRHKAAVDRLLGTLDQTSGAVTNATKAMIAQDLAQTKLQSTGESLATAVAKSGIAFNDFAAAASGNDAALQKVNAQLVAVAESQLKQGPMWTNLQTTMGKYSISLEQVTAAALGNVGAQNEIATAFQKSGLNANQAQNRAQALVDQYRGQLDPALVESAMLLGDHAGALDEASAATQRAADATVDWAGTLQDTKGALQEFGQIIQANGNWDAAAIGATQLSEAFIKLGDAAQAGARNAARAITDAGGSIEAAGAAAAASVAQSRAEFLKMADSIGIPKAAAMALADTLGLLPRAVELNIETNADETQAQLNEIADRLQNLPKGTTELRVTALTDDAIRRLDDIGIKVEKLKDGTFVLHLDNADFLAKLQAAQDAAKGLLKPFIAKLDLDTADADAKLNDFKTRGGAGNVAIPISFKHDVADQQLQTLQQQAQQPQTMPLNANPAQAQAQIQALQQQAQQPQTMPLDANPAAAQAKLGALVGQITGTVATMGIDAAIDAALAKLAAAVGAVTATVATMVIDGNNAPAIQKGAQARDTIASFKPVMVVDSNPAPAVAKARAAVAAINAMKATITVTTNEIHNVTRNFKDVGLASGGGVMKFAKGGFVPGFAPGRDVVPALLSPGEAVLVPEAVRALGGRAIANLNKTFGNGRRALDGTPAAGMFNAGRAGSGTGSSTAAQAMVKNYYLTVINAGNNEVDLREQFRKMEVLGV
jgi:hypothetical protein